MTRLDVARQSLQLLSCSKLGVMDLQKGSYDNHEPGHPSKDILQYFGYSCLYTPSET
jgi:hypothetical protein